MERNTVYFWKVRGTTAVDTSSWSVVRSFTTEGYIGISEYLNEEAILIYPNPSNGVFSIQSELEISRIDLFNVLGENIYSTPINAKQAEFDLSQKSKGIYFYQIHAGNNQIIKSGKIIFK